MQVRSATSDDIPAIWRLIQELAAFERLSHTVDGSADELARYLFEEKLVQARVAEISGAIVGYTLCYRTFSTFRTNAGLWLEDIYVTPAHRSQGIGKALMEGLLASARAEGCKRVEWSVLDWNEGAIAFYRSIGAQVLGDWRICRWSPD